MSDWSPDKVVVLRALWAEGYSAAQIARVIGNVSRNQVIGKAHRLGLSGRATPPRAVAKVAATVSVTVRASGTVRNSPPKPEAARGRIRRPPGSTVLRVTEFLFPRKIHERVFAQIVSDMHEEYFEACAGGQLKKARWIVLRGHVACLSAAATQVPISLGRLIVELWRLGNL